LLNSMNYPTSSPDGVDTPRSPLARSMTAKDAQWCQSGFTSGEMGDDANPAADTLAGAADAEVPTCMHEVTARLVPNLLGPGQVLLLTQTDVTARDELCSVLTALSEAQ